MPDSHRPLTLARRSTVRSRLAVALLLVLAAVLTTVEPASAAPRKARASYRAAIEPLAGYQPQTTCSPWAKPGVVDLSRRLLRAYPGTRSLGIVRACAAGGRSEHKEGRAFDWGGLRASRAADRAKVNNFTTWLFATDRHGNRRAMARRLGIQYVIWNKRIWGSYAASSGWRRYTGANPHTDHVHISFTWAGARKATSFWTGRVGNVAAAPKPTLPPPATGGTTTTPPRPEPARTPTLPAGPEVVDETVTLAGQATGATMTGALVEGQPYLIETSGTWSFASGGWADAECSKTSTDAQWRRDRSVHRENPWADHLDLYVDGVDLLSRADSGDECDSRNHVYRWMYTPSRTGRVTFQVWDPTKLSDNRGALTIRVIRSAPADELTWPVRARARTGATSPGALEGGATYVATVSGVVNAGQGVTSDAECSATATDPVWRRNRAVVGSASDDDLDILLDREDISAQPIDRQEGDENCDTSTHTYRWLVRVDETRPVNVRIDDPTPGDNAGWLTVRMEKVPPVVGPEDVTVDSAAADGTATARTYLAGQPLVIRATGTYTIRPGITADAECSSTTTDQTWRSSRTQLTTSSGRALGDVTVDGRTLDWQTESGLRCDGSGHRYVLSYTPRTTGPLLLGTADDDHSDNVGVVSVTVEPAG